MNDPVFNYDEASDTLYVSFSPGERATGIELTDHILLRINAQERRVVGITLLDYSVLVQPTDLGVRSFPLSGLTQLAPETQSLALDVLTKRPVRDILTVSAFTPTPGELIPIVSVHPVLPVADAA